MSPMRPMAVSARSRPAWATRSGFRFSPATTCSCSVPEGLARPPASAAAAGAPRLAPPGTGCAGGRDDRRDPGPGGWATGAGGMLDRRPEAPSCAAAVSGPQTPAPTGDPLRRSPPLPSSTFEDEPRVASRDERSPHSLVGAPFPLFGVLFSLFWLMIWHLCLAAIAAVSAWDDSLRTSLPVCPALRTISDSFLLRCTLDAQGPMVPALGSS
mmetsp:Transcript_73164/g.167850  ORF Transcript_73164/g.167850 Transcript_73164/m.167850 type:complete len:212 (-) Transcript_73164:1063-1698(-)